jgi:hypothetical protein
MPPVTRNSTILLIAVLCVVVGAGGYWIYDRQHRSAVALNVGGHSVTIETR